MPEVAASVADGFHRIERRAADEDGEPPEQLLFLRREQAEAPFDRGAERLLAFGKVLRART